MVEQYWCDYCHTFLADGALSRKAHETGQRHIGNRERFIRGMYKGGEKEKKLKAEHASALADITAVSLTQIHPHKAQLRYRRRKWPIRQM